MLFDIPASDVTRSYIVLRSPCLKTEEKAVLRVACFPVMQFCNDNLVILSGHADVHDRSSISYDPEKRQVRLLMCCGKTRRIGYRHATSRYGVCLQSAEQMIFI